MLKGVRWANLKGDFYRRSSCMSVFIRCYLYESTRILSVTMSTLLEQKLNTKAPANAGVKSSELSSVGSVSNYSCFQYFFGKIKKKEWLI